MTVQRKPGLYLVLDVSLKEKFLSLAYSGAAGSLAAVAGKEAVGLGIKLFSLGTLLPEFAATAVGVIAFSHTAHAASEAWARNVPADALRLREMRAPRIKI